MSLLAGFDLVLELARPPLRRHLLATTIGGTPLQAPCELVVSIHRSGIPSEGIAVFDVEDVALSLVPGTDRVELTCSFTYSSIDFHAVHAEGLDGYLGISFPLRIEATPAGGISSFLFAVLRGDLTSSNVTLHLSRSAQQILADAVASSGMSTSAQEVEARVSQAVAALAKSGTSPAYPATIGFPILPNQDALFPVQGQPLLQIPHLPSLDVVRCVDSETVAVFGRLLTTTPLGDPSAKTAGARNGYDVALSISAEAFRRLIFCRALALKVWKPDSASEQWLIDQVAALPSCCGGGRPFPYQGATVKSVCCSLREGYIETDGSFEKSGFCYHAVGTFSQRTTVAVETVEQDGKQTRVIRAKADAPTHEEEVRVPWFCASFQPWGWFLDYGAFGALSQIAGDILDALIDPDIKVAQPPDVPLFPLEGVVFEDVAIVPEALTLRGQWFERMRPIAGGFREVGLVGAVIASDPVKIGDGVIPVGGAFCDERNFTWEEFRQRQEAAYEAVAHGWTGDLSYSWSLEHYRGYWGSISDPFRLTSRVEITEDTNIFQIPVDLHFEAPPPIGITFTDQPVTLQIVENEGPKLSIRNWIHRYARTDPPLAGSFSLTLRVKVTDQTGVSKEAVTTFRITGEYVHMQDGYDDYIAGCIAAAAQAVSKYSYKTVPVPHDGDPGGLVEIIQSIYASEAPEREELLSLLLEHGRKRYGPNFDGALLVPAGEAPNLRA